MSKVKNIFNTFTYYFFFCGVLSLFILIILQIPVIKNVNNLITDQLQGDIKARNEIVVVKIDDESLGKIGAWPWDRSIFGKVIDNISSDKPAVIGIDVTFLESRKGDDKFIASLKNSGVPIILASKLVDNQNLISPLAKDAKTEYGYVNFNPDSDGKIRRVQVHRDVLGKCEPSFALAIFEQYLHINNAANDCLNVLKLRNQEYGLDQDATLSFTYSKSSFNSISISDVLQGKFDPGMFKNKIVLIGSTALDLRNDLNDNFTSIFGNTIAGINVHGNIINSFLEESFYKSISTKLFVILGLLILAILSILYWRIKKSIADLGLLLSAIIIFNLIGLFAFDKKVLFPFFSVNLALIGGYILSLIFKFFIQGRENRFIKQAFARYVNPVILRQMVAKPEQLKLGGQTREMSVLFSDIRGFTTISEGMRPDELITFLNNYLEKVSGVILDINGTIDKFIGDAVMAFWNAPLDDPNHAEHSIRAGMLMQNIAKEYNAQNPSLPPIKIGVGINTGDMVVGNIGSDKRFDYTVLGDNVNLGSRLEGLTKQYGVGIIVAESTKEKIAADSDIKFRLLDKVKVKGKDYAINIYEPFKENDQQVDIVKVFAEGFKNYVEGNFQDAIRVFGTIRDIDGPAKLMYDRSHEMIQNKPEHWDGVWKWEQK